MKPLMRSISPWRNGRMRTSWIVVGVGVAEAVLAVLLLVGLQALSSSRRSLELARTPAPERGNQESRSSLEDGSRVPAETEPPLTDGLIRAVNLAARQGFVVPLGETVAVSEVSPSWNVHRGRWAFHACSQSALGLPRDDGFMLVYGWDPGAAIRAGFLCFGEQGGTQILAFRSLPYPRRRGTSAEEDEKEALSDRQPGFARVLHLAETSEDTRPLVRALEMAVEVFERERFLAIEYTLAQMARADSEFDSGPDNVVGYSDPYFSRTAWHISVVPDRTDTMAFLFGGFAVRADYCESDAVVLVHPDGAVTYAGVRGKTAQDREAPGAAVASESVLPGLTRAFAIACEAVETSGARGQGWQTWATSIEIERRPDLQEARSVDVEGPCDHPWMFRFLGLMDYAAGCPGIAVVVDSAGNATVWETRT